MKMMIMIMMMLLWFIVIKNIHSTCITHAEFFNYFATHPKVVDMLHFVSNIIHSYPEVIVTTCCRIHVSCVTRRDRKDGGG
mmetsp:Transcript_21988/g.30802  ORF Transcript_21988/g.30802 Transcript_21988/m.30802 type:complete len:81 (-) Transcript_21988:76-318(-)